MQLTYGTFKRPMTECGCCGSQTGWPLVMDGREHAGLNVCCGCGGIVGRCYRGDSPVLLRWSVVEHIDPETIRYFDLELLGSEGVERTHGWYNPADRAVVQFG